MTLIQALFRRLASRATVVPGTPQPLSPAQQRAVSGGIGESSAPRSGW